MQHEAVPAACKLDYRRGATDA